jgi:hypothetical protein
LSRQVFKSVLALIGCAVLVVASATTTDSVKAQNRPPILIDLGDSSALREQFNRDRGLTRLVLLVSPT